MKRESDPARALRRMLGRRPAVNRALGSGWRNLKRLVEGPEHGEIRLWFNQAAQSLTAREWKLLLEQYDDSTPLPDGAASALSGTHPRLQLLRQAYATCALPVTVPSVWNDDLLAGQLDMRYFRGESPFVWSYREGPRAMELKYFLFTEYVRGRDDHKLLERLGEDGAFGCWTFEYPGVPPVSRDLLDSVNELCFLDRHLGILDQPRLRVLDIGAGYGRTA